MYKPLIISAILGFTGVALGAFGAHALNQELVSAGTLELWKTAVFYQISHALALFCLALGDEKLPSKRLSSACALLWGVGVVLFSGSLYGLALTGPRWLGPVTPLGGSCLLAGWALLFIMGLKCRRD